MLRKILVSAAMLAFAAGMALAQQTSTGDERGFVSFAEFGSSFNSSGHVVKLDTSAGYNLSEHFGVDFGVPFYFVGGSSTSSTGTKTSFSGTGLGAPYMAARAMYKSESFNYASRFSIFLPAGDNQDGLSTRQTSVDWTNHFEYAIERVTPFGEIGIANTVADTSKYNRPYASYGANAHIEGGASVDVAKKVSVGGSAYDIFPWGTQTLYSRSVPKGSVNLPAKSNSGKSRAFEQYSVIAGASELGKDKGFTAWGDYTPVPYMTAEVAYNRSVEFALNTVSLSMRFNIGYLAKHRARK